MQTQESMTEANRWIIAVSVMLATILEILDSTIVNIALPHMMGSFGATFDQITWVLTSYIVAAAMIMPISGFLINRLGSKKLLLINIIGFMITSMLCGLATSLLQMVFFRVLQGIFGASLVPLSQFILRNTFPPEHLTKAMAIWGVGIMAGPILGPTIGGFITESLNWRWIFYINIPFCIVDIFLCIRFISETPTKHIKTDVLGIILLILSVGCLQIFLDRGNTVNWFEAQSSQWFFGIFSFSFIGFLIHSFTHETPIINLKLFMNTNFSVCCFLIAVFVACAIGIISIQPLYLENLMGYPPDFTGLIMAPRGLASACTMACVPLLSKRFDQKILIFSGMALNMLASYLFSKLDLSVSPHFFIYIGIVQGIGMGLFFVPLTTIAFNTLPYKDYAEASGIFSFCRNLGMSIGISLIATLISRSTQTNWNSLISQINKFGYSLHYNHINTTSKIGLAQLAHQVLTQATTISFLNVYRAIVIVLIISLPFVFFLTKKNESKKKNTEVELH
jgi:DHA2 family multidrug resistance protein